MWIFTTIGFFSVVAHAEDQNTVVIRAGVREDLDALRVHHLPDIEIREEPGDAYAYQALVSRDEWEHAAQQLAATVGYRSFEPDQAAMRWLMQRLQSEAAEKSSRSAAQDSEHHLG